MTKGRVGASHESGQMYDSTAIQQDGTYELNLRANQRTVVQVLLRDYNFEPTSSVFYPGQNRQIPDFVATPKLQGSIEVSTKKHAKGVNDAKLVDQKFRVTDADTGRLLSIFTLNRQGRFRMNAQEGTKIIIEPEAGQGLQWIPPQYTTTITRSSQKTAFVYLQSSEVGAGNLNLSKDRADVRDYIEVSLKSVDLNRGKFIVGDQVELQARAGRGAPPESLYSFLVRYDNERNFRTIANLQPGNKARFKLERPGGFESKVALTYGGLIIGGATIRNYAVSSPNERAPGVERHDPSAPFPMMVDDWPQFWHMDLRFSIDRSRGPILEPRRLKLDAWAKADLEARRVPREGRRLTFLMRHEDDREWTIVNQNVPTLEWSWTPPSPGKWTLRVDYVKGEGNRYSGEDGRAQITFTAMGIPAVSSSSSGLAAETPPPSRPGFRPFATPAPTPRPTLRPVPMPSPKATPRPVLRPVATPKPQTSPRPFLRPFSTSKPKPTPE